MNPSSLRRFGVFEVDLRTGEVRKSGVRVALQEQPFRVLARLLERQGDLVTRDELRRELWKDDTFVDFDHGLNVAIKRVRDALGDSAETPRFIETLPRRGYRFIAPVTSADSAGETGAAAGDSNSSPRGTRDARWWVMAASIAGASILGSGALLMTNGRPLTDGDAVLVADFVNSTGEEVFDASLRQGLSVQLAQSPSFVVVSRERVRDALTQMTRSPDDSVTGQVARDACQRVGAKAAVLGRIARLGEHYVIGLEAIDCFSGETVAIDQVEAAGRERVLSVLSASASRIRGQLGESMASIRRFDVPLEQATTSSLEALKAFTIAEDLMMRTISAPAVASLLKRALELDPEFAMAYARLSVASSALGNREDEIAYAREAYARRHRATEKERFHIDGRYCVTQPDSSARNECFKKVRELWARTYPHDWLTQSNLAARYLARGRYEEAIQHALEAIRLNPNQGFGYLNAVDAYMSLNRFEDAKRVTDAALDRQVFGEWIRAIRFDLAFVAGDEAAMAAERKAVAGTPGQAELIAEDGAAAAFGGQWRRRRARWAEAERLLDDDATRRDDVPLHQDLFSIGAMMDAAVGLGDHTGEMPDPVIDVVRVRLGIAALLSGNHRRAAAQFQWIKEHRGIDPVSVFYPLAYLQHGRASARDGDVSTARRDYETFLSFWKDADPDVPILQQAKAEYAALSANRH